MTDYTGWIYDGGTNLIRVVEISPQSSGGVFNITATAIAGEKKGKTWIWQGSPAYLREVVHWISGPVYVEFYL